MDIKAVINIYKPPGYTLGNLISSFRSYYPEYQKLKIGYAGRLDPMAEGVVLFLVGEENKKASFYQKLPKTYQFQALFNLTTDTYDLLGIPSIKKFPSIQNNFTNELSKILPLFKGKITQQLPPYSAYRVKGKPLYYWARKGEIAKLNLPTKKVEIKNLEIEKVNSIKTSTLLDQIPQRIELVQGKFRQEKILTAWKKLLAKTEIKNWPTADFNISCSSGTYVRTLAHDIGKKLGTYAIAFSIKRTSIAEYSSRNSIKI